MLIFICTTVQLHIETGKWLYVTHVLYGKEVKNSNCLAGCLFQLIEILCNFLGFYFSISGFHAY